MAVIPSINSTPIAQGHAQSFSNYLAKALIGGNKLIGDSVITQESQLKSRPSRTTYSDFSAKSLIDSSDLNSSVSFAINNLISSRSGGNYNSTAMVSVNPNLLHSVKVIPLKLFYFEHSWYGYYKNAIKKRCHRACLRVSRLLKWGIFTGCAFKVRIIFIQN